VVNETLALVSGVVAITLIVLSVVVVYYKLGLKRLNLIERGLWKPQHERSICETVVIQGAVLIAIGAAFLLATVLPGYLRIEEVGTSFLIAVIGLVPLGAGIALVVCSLILRRRPERNRS